MAANKLYVGNLSWKTTDSELHEFFAQYGEVAEAMVIQERDTGRSRGFGFVTMASKESVEKALESNGVELGGRQLKVNLAAERSSGGGRSRQGGGGSRW